MKQPCFPSAFLAPVLLFILLAVPAAAICPCNNSIPGFDNFCDYPPSTTSCPMTYPGGYCDPNGDHSYTDGDWVRGYYEYQGACSSTSPTCRCLNGVDYAGRAIDPNATYCGYRICGRDNQNYECRSTGWVAIGGSPCSISTCRCLNGVDYSGRAIDPNSTYCGFRVCGRDNQYYECRSTGWVAIGGSPCATPQSCRCTNGTDFWGRAIDPNSTYCGYRVCGRDNQNYECRSTGWVAIGGSPCSTTSGGIDCFGLAINANGVLGAPPPAELSTLGVRWVRTLVLKDSYAMVRRLGEKLQQTNPRVQVLVVFNSQSFNDTACGTPTLAPPGTCNWTQYIDTYTNALRTFATNYDRYIDAYEIWNEPDLTGVPDANYDDMLTASYSRLRQVVPSKPILLSAPAGANWNSYLNTVLTSLGGTGSYDGLSFHPYGTKISGVSQAYSDRPTLQQTIMDAYNLQPSPRKQVWITEFGLPLADVTTGTLTAEQVQAQYLSAAYQLFAQLGPSVIGHAFWFAWSDHVQSFGSAGSRFGLVDVQLNRRRAWEAYRLCGQGSCSTNPANVTPATAPSGCPCGMYDPAVDNFCSYPMVVAGTGKRCPQLLQQCPNLTTNPDWTMGYNTYLNACITNCTAPTCGVLRP